MNKFRALITAKTAMLVLLVLALIVPRLILALDTSTQTILDARGTVKISGDYALVNSVVFKNIGNQWYKLITLPFDSFGQSENNIDLNGHYAILGNTQENTAAIFYRENDVSWLREDLEIPEEVSNASGSLLFGYSVSIWDGYAFVGSHTLNIVFVYKRSVDSVNEWHLVDRLHPQNDTTKMFGSDVASDNGFLVVGAKESCLAEVFVLENERWVWYSELVPLGSGNPGANQFGYNVDIEDDTIVVTAYNDKALPLSTEPITGAAYIYKYLAGEWQQSGRIADKNGQASDWFGHGLSLYGDYIAVGADKSSGDGAVYIFVESSSGWLLTYKINVPGESMFGYSVAISDKYLLVSGGDGRNVYSFGAPAIEVPQYSISGVVTDEGGAPLGQVELRGFLEDVIKTNSSGSYRSSVPEGWSLKITASKTGYVFSPVEQVLLVVNENLVDKNFVGTYTEQTLAGRVLTASGEPVPNVFIGGVTVSSLLQIAYPKPSATTYTDSDGQFSMQLERGENFKIMPQMPTCYVTYTRVPPSDSLVSSYIMDQDYVDEIYVVEYRKISGQITDSNGAGIQDVTVRADTSRINCSAVTDSNGQYSFYLNNSFDGTIIAEHPDYTFAVSAINVSAGVEPLENQNFSEEATYLTGDVNGDGVINIVDALMVARYAIDIPVPGINIAVADVNGDQKIDIIDALMIAQYGVGVITSFQ